MSYKIKIISQRRTLKAQSQDILADRIREAGIDLNFACGRRGFCGKCIVEIIKGPLPPLTEKEKLFLEQKRLKRNFRLSCLYKIQSDLALRIPQGSLLPTMPVLKTGWRRSIAINSPVRKYLLQLEKPTIDSPLSLLDLVQSQFRRHGQRGFSIALDSLKDLGAVLESNGYKTGAVIYNEKECLGFEPLQTIDRSYGLAIDLGTTTIVMELVNLTTGETVDVTTSLNSQVKYGTDIISRITAAFLDDKIIIDLKNSVLNTLNRMIQHILRKSKVSPKFVYEAVVAGNTAMNHFLLGLPLKTLAVSPYHAVFSELPPLSSSELGLAINKRGKVYVVPNIKSFVGGDIAAGLIAVDLEAQKGNYLFIDLGTNGEIVLKKGKEFMATSTAAGPAFEGMNISCGMLAFPGAIYRADYGKKIKTYTIADKPARGICGTGLIDLVAAFLERGIISPQGKVLRKSKKVPLTKNIYLSQRDIREMQLAVAAVKTGITMLLKKNSLFPSQLDRIYIAGAFGNYLNIANSMKIGLLPRLEAKKIFFIGNSSLAGARMILVSREEREKCRRLVRRIKHFSLATDPSFQSSFIRSLEFKSWS